jgi:sporulation protein YtfJ
MEHPINDIMATTLSKIREMMDVNTVVGAPIQINDQITVIPVSRVSLGFTSGGSDFVTKNHRPEQKSSFAGGSGAGVSIQPVSFLVIKGDNIRMIPVQSHSGTADKVIDMVPEVMDKLTDLFAKDKTSDEKDEASPF